MDDAWAKVDSTILASVQSQEAESRVTSFEDNFCFGDSETKKELIQTKFEPLPDSSTYLANLEKKLTKLQTKSAASSKAEKQDLISSLSSTREGHIDRLLNSNTDQGVEEDYFDSPVEDSLTNTVIRRVAPHLQALNASEFVHLVEADQLAIVSNQEEETAEPTK